MTVSDDCVDLFIKKYQNEYNQICCNKSNNDNIRLMLDVIKIK